MRDAWRTSGPTDDDVALPDGVRRDVHAPLADHARGRDAPAAAPAASTSRTPGGRRCCRDGARATAADLAGDASRSSRHARSRAETVFREGRRRASPSASHEAEARSPGCGLRRVLPWAPGAKLRFSMAHLGPKQRSPFRKSFMPSRRQSRQTGPRYLANRFLPSSHSQILRPGAAWAGGSRCVGSASRRGWTSP